MKKFICYLLAVVVAGSMVFTACKKSSGGGEDDPGTDTPSGPVTTAKGVPAGAPASKTIGAGGGELSTPDGEVRIVVPAGALQSNTNISIQPITNTLYENDPGKVAYRLLPEGVNFLKPVQVIFEYTDEDLERTVEDAMTVAWQQPNGSWKVVPTILNKQAKTLTIETNHFSDWTKTGGYEICISEDVLNKGEETLVYFRTVSDEDDLIPNIGVRDMEQLTALGNWKIVQGSGTLTPLISAYKGFSFRTKYKAPDNVTSPIHVVITGEVKGFNKIKDPSAPGGVRNTGHMILFGNITVVADGYIMGTMGSINMDMQAPYISGHVMGNIIQIMGDMGEYRVSLAANGATAGSYPMGEITDAGKGWVTFDKITNTIESYTSGFYKCGQAGDYAHSTGTLYIDTLPPVGGYIKGAFYGPLYRTGICGPPAHEAAIKFSVPRTR
ncbi:MAG TPA: hypothetical protein VD996_16710 [Chitinophagaceae bacterium]|nr:hypothetical protein [Chitinophagaceae bacterium]